MSAAAARLREFYDALGRNASPSELMALLDPEAEIVDLPQVPGTRRRRGHAELAAWLAETREVWGDLRVEVEELLELDAERCLAVTSLSGRARASGIDVAQRQSSAVLVRDGRILRMELYNERAEALRRLDEWAAGPS